MSDKSLYMVLDLKCINVCGRILVINPERNISNETSDTNVLNEVFMIVKWNQRKYGYRGNSVQMAGEKNVVWICRKTE
jgi:hypothetical protein